MDGAGERALIRGIVDGVIAEGDIADDGVKVIVGKRRLLEAFGEYRGIGIQLARDAGGDGVEFNAGAVA